MVGRASGGDPHGRKGRSSSRDGRSGSKDGRTGSKDGRTASKDGRARSPSKEAKMGPTGSKMGPTSSRGSAGSRSASKKESLEERKERYERNRLQTAIDEFFHSVDEDGNGYLESHEFAVAQALIAGLADGCCDEDRVQEFASEVTTFDENADSRISKEEFENGMFRICAVLKERNDRIIHEMATSAAYVVSFSRRELGREVRNFFSSMDEDHSGTLDSSEVAHVVELAHSLVDQQGEAAAAPLHEMVEKMMSFANLDKSQDGKIEVEEFVPAFSEFLKFIKVPKKDLVVKLRNLSKQPRGAPPAGSAVEDQNGTEAIAEGEEAAAAEEEELEEAAAEEEG